MGFLSKLFGGKSKSKSEDSSTAVPSVDPQNVVGNDAIQSMLRMTGGIGASLGGGEMRPASDFVTTPASVPRARAAPASFDPEKVIRAKPMEDVPPVMAFLGEHYRGEETAQAFRGNGGLLRDTANEADVLQRTDYKDEAWQAKHGAKSNRGRLVLGKDLADTTGAQPGLVGSTGNRMIYAHGGADQVVMADAMSEIMKGGQNYYAWLAARDAVRGSKSNAQINEEHPELAHAPSIDYFHHSSLLAGAPVLGAGEIDVRRGTVKAISNESGHYRPGAENLLQTMETLSERQGVELGTAKVDLRDAKGLRTGLHGGEFLRSGGNVELMDARTDMRNELLSKVQPVAPAAEGQGARNPEQVVMTLHKVLEEQMKAYSAPGADKEGIYEKFQQNAGLLDAWADHLPPGR